MGTSLRFRVFYSDPRTTIDISIFPKAPFIKEELEANHAHARHLSHTTHAVKKLPNTTEPLTTPGAKAKAGSPLLVKIDGVA